MRGSFRVVAPSGRRARSLEHTARTFVAP